MADGGDLKTVTYTTIDKTTWGDGPWQQEPDKVQWIDQGADLDCLAVRHPQLGHWCGYVGVPPGHPCYGVDYDAVRIPGNEGGRPNVHGGLTYAALCVEGDDEAKGICHVPAPGRPHEVWWLGFDCAHLHDFSPGYEHTYPNLHDFSRGYEHTYPTDKYRTLEYVRRECASLAAQLK